MKEFSVLVGGRAGDGINESGLIISRIFNQLGYYLFQYYDYPSLIRGGHNFTIVRASTDKVGAHRDKVDFILALNQDTIDLHKGRLKESTITICDSDEVRSPVPEGESFPLKRIIQEVGAPPIARNSCLIGGFCKVAGIEWDVLETVMQRNIPKMVELNLKVARRGYEGSKERFKLERLDRPKLPIITGNEIIGLGLIRGGLKSYVAYPMTPSSGVLHFLARVADDFSLKVVHPENEIAVMLMALGFAYAGKRVALGTSGGGFCLMNEGLSLSGMAELPVVIVLAQRTGPSTGVPTYTAQSDLHFAINAGQGEFTRLVIAPGDSEQAYYWAGAALDLSWKYQIPSILLTDKTLAESAYSFDQEMVEVNEKIEPILWEGGVNYERYSDTDSGISPLAFPPNSEATIKVNSYAHMESGITTEDGEKIRQMQDKLLRKEKSLVKDLEEYETVTVYGNPDSTTALFCWGSNKGVCSELAERYNLRVVQPVVLSPFPTKRFSEAVDGVEKTILVECNSTGQLARLIGSRGHRVDDVILKYDGRPISVDELDRELKRVME
jgi:2-oxoglutarate ferredoxin oxidoreductase subunit alpha